MHKCMVVKWKRKRQKGSWAVVRGRTEEARTVRNGLMLVACLSPGTRVVSRPELLPMTDHIWVYDSWSLC